MAFIVHNVHRLSSVRNHRFGVCVCVCVCLCRGGKGNAMQPQAPPMTPLEEKLTQAYQLMGGARMQSAILHRSTTFCIDHCLDTEELYTLLRTTEAPIRYRLQKDLEEKKCVNNCGAKWDEMYRATTMRLNEEATHRVQMQAMTNMMESMRQ